MILRNISRIAPRFVSRRLPVAQKALHTSTTLTPVVSWSSSPSSASLPLSHRCLGSLDESKFNLQEPRKGTGFDNFTPRDGGSKPSDDDANKTEQASDDDKQADKKKETKSEADSSSQNKEFSNDEKEQGGKSGGRNDNNNNNNTDPNRFENWIPAVLMLLITFYMTQRPGADATPAIGGSSDREISWHDFLRLLQQQDVVKVVVTDDRQAARVYLKANALGLARNSSAGSSAFGSTASSSSSSSYEEQRRQRAANRDKPLDHAAEMAEFHNQEQEHMEGLHSSPSPSLQNVVGGGSSGGGLRHTPFFYRMHIGSVETFERKLDEAQRALKRDPENDVPVQYLPDSVSVQQLGLTRVVS